MTQNNNPENRTRNHQVKIRMTDAEYDDFVNKLENSHLTMQSYILNAIKNIPLPSAASYNEIVSLSSTIRDELNQLRGIAVNINQLARVANSVGDLPSESKYKSLAEKIMQIRKEKEDTWQLLNQLIRDHHPTEQ